MLPEVSSQLSKLAEQKRLKEKLARDLQAVQTELQEKSVQLVWLTRQLEKEKVDVEKLERSSLTALFYSVLGSREEQLEKERQELLSAQLRYHQTKRQVEALHQDKDSLEQRLGPLAGVESEYQLLLAEKEGLLRQSNLSVGRELVALSEQIANVNSEINELTEAVAAGNNVGAGLSRVIQSLENAEGWGTWDLLGGGMLSTAMKHSRIDEARQAISDVQIDMGRFKRELADVQKNIDLQIDIGAFTSFADYFFDGLIVDWVVQAKIADSLARAKNAREAVMQTVQQLEELSVQARSKIGEVEEKRASIIERTT